MKEIPGLSMTGRFWTTSVSRVLTRFEASLRLFEATLRLFEATLRFVKPVCAVGLASCLICLSVWRRVWAKINTQHTRTLK